MATDLENLLARRTAILTELASITGKPTYSIDGQNVDWAGYRKSLYEELAAIGELVDSIGGPFEVHTTVIT
ncbi:MAG: hypothetical protein IMZ55_05190 [Acidobacteria bacterium]|nr:hypothetical protein [Acidobacteriota bacterium]